jgi:dihydrodipicolinate synthase/N-acetylneuraminate lyase
VAGVKAAMDLNGFCGGDPRKPLLPLSTEQLATLKASLGKSAFAQ